MFSVIGLMVNPRTGINGDVGPLTAYSKSPAARRETFKLEIRYIYYNIIMRYILTAILFTFRYRLKLLNILA